MNIADATSYQLLTKVMEHVSVGKPVLNPVSTANDSSVRFFGSYPAVVNLLTHAEETTPNQRDEGLWFLEKPPPAMNPSEFDSWIAPCCVDSVATGYKNSLALARDGRV